MMNRLLPSLALLSLASAITYDDTSSSSIAAAGKTVAAGMMSYYTGNQAGQTPGLFPYPPYYWWESGTAFGHLIDYVYYTGDTSYNDEILKAMEWQAGTNGQFFPSNQSFDMGNDDQVFWTYSAMNAAEQNFPSPAKGYPTWAAMGAIVFNEQAARWDPTTCGGGLHWQVYQTNIGYNYFNVAANGGFFLLAARMARYTGNNNTYVEWAQKMWDWMYQKTVIIDSTTDPNAWRVYDGTQDGNGAVGGCTGAEKTIWSYNFALMFTGLAYLYNHTEDAKWLTPLNGILNGAFEIFFDKYNKVLVEVSCEPNNNCDSQPNWTVFKGVTIRWLATVGQLVPSLASKIQPYLDATAAGAAAQCDGNGGTTCGYHWTTSTWDGTQGLGQEMSALAAMMTPMIAARGLAPPLTVQTGATSNTSLTSNGANVGGTTSNQPGWVGAPITTGDKAGAVIVTIMLVCITVAGGYWMGKH